MKHTKKIPPVPGSIDAIVAEMMAMDMQYGKYMQYLYARQCSIAVREKGCLGMKKTVKRILLVLAGVVIGVAASQALLVSASRPAGVVGAEVVIPLALPTLLAIGWWVGRDTPPRG